jgi:enediyne biosynthesis protein E4
MDQTISTMVRTIRRVLCGLALWCLVLDLSALEWKQHLGYREAALPQPSGSKSGFTLMFPNTTGVAFTNSLAPARAAENQIRLNGSGLAAGDVDGDGLCDLYFCGLENGNRLYHNRGDWKFADISAQAGVACTNQFSTGAALADLDGDGDLDLLVNGIGVGTRCFLNDGKGHFTEANNSGLVRQFGSMSMALGDLDGDTDLDLYVANYRTTTIRSTGFAVLNIGGKRVIPPGERDRLEYTPDGRILEHGEVDVVYLNDGSGRFTQIPWTGGAFLDDGGKPLGQPPRDWGLTVALRDLNGDLAPDIYLANDFHSPDRIWINNGQGRFSPLPPLAIRHTPTFSMAVDFADVNRDGHDDFLALDMLERTHAMRLRNFPMSPANPAAVGEGVDRPQIDRNTLQLNRGDGTYADIAQYAGIEATTWSWSLIFLDVDLDGYEDVLLTTGNLFNTQDLDANARIAAHGPFRRDMIASKLLMYPPLFTPKLAYHNRRDLTFEEMGSNWGVGQAGVAHGMALADLDNDGDLDLVVNNLNAPAGLYRNNTPAPRVAVRLKGAGANTRGIGAKIKVWGGPVAQSQEMIGASRYLSCDDAQRVFAAGAVTNNLTIEVLWRSGKRSLIAHAQANRVYEIDESAAGLTRPEPPVATQPVFQDVTQILNHTHQEPLFDDFLRQPLLPNKLSQLGPGASWFDLDADGWEDLIIGSGNNGVLGVFKNDQRGGFAPMAQAPFTQAVTQDQTGIVGIRDSHGTAVLLVGSANYEDAKPSGSALLQYRTGAAEIDETFPGQTSSTGPIAVADLDGRGALSLFVGGRVIGGRYPEPASSLLFRFQNDKWVPDEENTRLLRHVGLVSGATFSDLDGDGYPELLLACEWGPIRVFSSKSGKLREVTRDLGLERYSGWWTSVSTGDFNGDGRMDIVAGNWGLNTLYQASATAPLRLYYGDLVGNGTVQTIEALLDPSTGQWVPRRDLNSVLTVMPFLAEKFATHQAYAESTLPQVLDQRLRLARVLEVNTLASMLFINAGSHFEGVPLPKEAQFAPAFGLAVADFDGDGSEDVFVSQNFFATQPQTPRSDAGRGLLLRGDGVGGFASVPGHQSGVMVYGEQRGCAVADYDHDGRVDLLVTVNGAQTRLFHNITAKPGLRVQLIGPPGNPQGIGAAMRLAFAGRAGARREVAAGRGYWSQDSAEQVLALPAPPAELEVRWPGGKVVKVTVPQNAKSVTVGFDGTIRSNETAELPRSRPCVGQSSSDSSSLEQAR